MDYSPFNERYKNVSSPFNPDFPILNSLLYNASLTLTAFNSSARLDDDISESSLLVEEEDPSPSSLDGRRGGWGDGRDDGMVWEEGPPHSIQTLTFPLSSSKYKQSSWKIYKLESFVNKM